MSGAVEVAFDADISPAVSEKWQYAAAQGCSTDKSDRL